MRRYPPRDRRLGGAHGLFGLGSRPAAGQGQGSTALWRFRSVLDPASIPVFFETPTFLWIDGDGVTPSIGPALGVIGAAPTAGQPTPHVLANGARLTQTEFGGAGSYSLAVGTPIDPGGLDLVAIIRFRVGQGSSTADRLFTNRGAAAAQWWQFRYHSGFSRMHWQVSGAAANINITSPNDSLCPASEGIACGIIDADGDCHLLLNGMAAVTAGGTPAGVWGGNEGIGLGALSDGVNPTFGGIAWATCWIGAGEADRWTANSYALVRRLFAMAEGRHFGANGEDVNVARASHAAWQGDNGRWHIASSDFSRCGDSMGLRYEGGVSNKCINNINPQVINGWAATWGAPVANSDAGALATAGASAWGPNTIRYANTSGVDQYLYNTGQAGNLNSHSVGCIGRIAAGAGVELGLYRIGTGVFVKGADLADNYVLTKADNVTFPAPAGVDTVLAFKVPNNATIRIDGATMPEASRMSTLIPNWSTVAGNARAEEVPNTQIVLSDDQQSIAGQFAPLEWDTAPPAAEPFVASDGNAVVSAIVGGNARLADGTTNLDVAAAWVDGTFLPIRASWIGSWPRMYLATARAAEGDAAYDGAIAGTVLRLGVTGQHYGMCVRDLHVQRSYQHGIAP